MTEIPLNILLADDDRDYRFLFEQALKELPIASHLTTVENGEELIHYLMKHTLELPTILFMDLSMPRKTGFECLHEIKESVLLKELPVVVLTVSLPSDVGYEINIEKMLKDLGAQGYIRKPHDFELLKTDIHNAINKALAKL
jgi:CheY-like chemotaxis protein